MNAFNFFLQAAPKTCRTQREMTMRLTTSCAAAALLAALAPTAQAEELNALIWCDHADPALL